MKLENVPLGTTVELYVQDNAIQNFRTNYTIKATIVGINVVGDDLPTRYLLGWERGKRPYANHPHANSAVQGLDYAYEADADGLLRVFGLQRMDQFIPGSQYFNSYKLHPDLSRFAYGKFVYYGYEIQDIHDDHFGDGLIVPATCGCGPRKFIKATDIQQGDTIAWITNKKELNYAFVYDVNEGEDLIENAIIVLDCKVFCNGGIRHFPNGYPLPMDANVLLISRVNNG